LAKASKESSKFLAKFFEVLGQVLQSSWKKILKYFRKNFEFLFEQFEQTIFFEDAKCPGSFFRKFWTVSEK
jgi:hypothetical protein